MCLNAFLWCFPWLLIGARVAGNLQLIMSIVRTRLFLWFSLLLLVTVPLGAVGSVCSRLLPSYNASSFNGGSFTGGVQLLIPSWNFSCEGTFENWFAHVNGNTSIVDDSGIEFQVLKPDPVKSNVYNLIYGNTYGDDVMGTLSASGARIEIDVKDGYLLPVRPGYIVGVYIDPNAANELSLLYEETEEDIDIYYWENLTGRMCDLSLCDAKVMRGRPLVGWAFKDFPGQVSSLEGAINLLRQNVQYCNSSEVSSCVLPMTVSTTLIPSSSLLVSSSDTVSSSLFMTTTSSSILTTPPSSSLVDSTSSTPSLSLPPPLPPPSSIIPSVTPSPTEGGGGGGGGFLDNLSIQVVAVLGVIVILVLLVIILSLIICICCLCRNKTSIEVSAAHSIENPDYFNGTMSVKRNDELTPSTSMPLPSIPVTMTTRNTYLEGSLRDSNVVADTHFMSSQSEAPGGGRKGGGGGEEKVDSKSWQHSSQPVPLSNGLPNNDYDVPEPSRSALSPQSHNGYTHYYSSPPPPGGEASPLLPPAGGPYYSLPTDSSPGIYDMPDTSSKVVPSTEDPEVLDSYDKIIIKDSSPPGESVPTGGDPFIYAYVPTSQQRLLNWRYEIPADQEYDKLNFFVQTQTFWKPAATTTGLYEQLASNKYREINRKEIVVSKTLGEGQFGYVSKGMWAHTDERHEVAVKMLKPDATDQDRLKLLQEAAIMGQFSHKNIVKLHGVVTVGEPVMMLLEFMPRGELKAYLRSIRSKLNNRNVMANLPKLLLRFCRDIASGMSYLSEKSFVHRDLAARNVLLTSDLTCKIGDFGMARDLMEDESNYYKSSGGIIPLKWTAPEALNFKKYTSASDVWSYGMVLHEIWSLGHKPFNDLSNPIVIALVNSKHCQAPPPGCSRAVYQLMVQCWNPEHSLRPKFSRISEYLRESDETLLRWSREDLAVGKEVSQLGAPLEVSTDLYVDLQRTYQAAMLEQSSRNSS